MVFEKKEWEDRHVEFAGRRTLTDVSTGEMKKVDVARAEGNIFQVGDAFSAANMNDLEQRIADTFGGFGFYPEKLTQDQYNSLSEEIKSTPGLIFVIVKE